MPKVPKPPPPLAPNIVAHPKRCPARLRRVVLLLGTPAVVAELRPGVAANYSVLSYHLCQLPSTPPRPADSRTYVAEPEKRTGFCGSWILHATSCLGVLSLCLLRLTYLAGVEGNQR